MLKSVPVMWPSSRRVVVTCQVTRSSVSILVVRRSLRMTTDVQVVDQDLTLPLQVVQVQLVKQQVDKTLLIIVVAEEVVERKVVQEL